MFQLRNGQHFRQPEAGAFRRAEPQQRQNSTKARDESYLRSLVLPVSADIPIGAIGVFDVQGWVTDLNADGYARATIRQPRFS